MVKAHHDRRIAVHTHLDFQGINRIELQAAVLEFPRLLLLVFDSPMGPTTTQSAAKMESRACVSPLTAASRCCLESIVTCSSAPAWSVWLISPSFGFNLIFKELPRRVPFQKYTCA
jgi:hypothetical protein